MGVIGGVGGYHTNVSGDCGQCSNIGAVSANVTDMSCSGWEPIGQTCNISVYTVTADCQFRSESSAFAVVHLKCMFYMTIIIQQERIKERERVTSVCYSTGRIQNHYYK